MFRTETHQKQPGPLPAIRALIVAIPAAAVTYLAVSWVGLSAPWPELAGALAGGFLIGRLSRR